MLASAGRMLISSPLGGSVQSVCCPAQRNLTQCRQIFTGKEVAQRTLRLSLLIDFSLLAGV